MGDRPSGGMRDRAAYYTLSSARLSRLIFALRSSSVAHHSPRSITLNQATTAALRCPYPPSPHPAHTLPWSPMPYA